jgi:hypothetical protein
MMTLSEIFSPALFLVVIAACIAYAVICRLRYMDHSTWWVIFSVVVPEEWAGVSLGAGLVIFLALGSPRWRDGVPGKSPPPPAIITHPWAGD